LISDYDFATFTKLYSAFWSVNFDIYKAKEWHNLLGELKIKGLIEAIQALAKEEKFPPAIKTIVDKYAELKAQQTKEIRERKIAEQEKYMLASSEGQNKCVICDNTGVYLYRRGVYEYSCRCICARGKDLNQFGEYQTTKGHLWHNPTSGRMENLYYNALDDIFTAEEIGIIKLKKSEINPDIEFGSNVASEFERARNALVGQMSVES